MGRQLKSINKTGQSISFRYNDSGIRTEKTVNGVKTTYHLVGDKVTFESNGTDNVYYTYDSAGKLVSMNLNGTEYFYVRNAQGDIIGLIDKVGTQVVAYNYDSWGKLISIKDATGADITNNTTHVGYKNPYRYRGYRYDTETGLYYLHSRYYNPVWGRFINADAIIGQTGELLGHNMFAYCKNNPVNKVDLNGFKSIPIYESDDEYTVTIDRRWDVNIEDTVKTGESKTLRVSDSNRSSYDHKSSIGVCYYKEIEIKKVQVKYGTKESPSRGYQVRAYFKGDYIYGNKLDTAKSFAGVATGLAGKTKNVEALMGKLNSNVNTKMGGNILIIISTGYYLYTEAYNAGLAPEYEVLYSDIE